MGSSSARMVGVALQLDSIPFPKSVHLIFLKHNIIPISKLITSQASQESESES